MRLTPRTLGLSGKLAWQEASITQPELTRRIHVPRTWLGELENGKEDRNLGMAKRLLSQLEYSLELRRTLDRKSEKMQHD